MKNRDDDFWYWVVTLIVLTIGGLFTVKRCAAQETCEKHNGVFVNSDWHPMEKCVPSHPLPEREPTP